MKVEISHDVDILPDQVYNYLTYDFLLSDCRVRARVYADEMGKVTLMGRFNLDGTAHPAMLAARSLLQSDTPRAASASTALELFEAMDPRRVAEFPEVLAYLRDRFNAIEQMGPTGSETIASGLSPAERDARTAEWMKDGFYQSVKIDVDLKGHGE